MCSLHDALPISGCGREGQPREFGLLRAISHQRIGHRQVAERAAPVDRFGQRRERVAIFAEPVMGSSEPHHRRSEEHTSELQSLMRISYAVFCLKKKNIEIKTQVNHTTYT